MRPQLLQQWTRNLRLQSGLLLAQQLLRGGYSVQCQLSPSCRRNLCLRHRLHQLQRSLLQMPAGCALELLLQPVHLRLRTELSLLRLRRGLRLQLRLRQPRRCLPDLPPRLLRLQRVLRDLPRQLRLQPFDHQMRLPLGLLHQPVGHLRHQMRHQLGLQRSHPELHLPAGSGEGQRGLPDLSCRLNACP
jgi:hypothetical protein